MASIRTRVAKDGTTTHVVNFRHGSKQSTKTFDNPKSADDFKVLVEQFGPDRALALLAEVHRPIGITLDELAQRWLEFKKPDLTPNIYVGYVRDYNTWIKPKLGHLEAQMIDEIVVQDWVDWMRRTPSAATKELLSPKSVVDRHAILHQIFAFGSARTRQLVPRNPCKETRLPERKKSLPKGLRLTEFYRLLEAGERVDPETGEKVDQDTADLVAFMADSSWRISEAIAILVESVEVEYVRDEETGEEIRQVFVTMERVWRKGVGWVSGDAKSAASLRRLQLIGPAADVVYRRIQGKKPSDFVFTFKDGRPGLKSPAIKPWNVNSFRKIRWARLLAAAGLEMTTRGRPTPHWLRHTHVALCIAAGLSLPEIQARLGHEDIQTTINVYGRMMAEINAQAAARLKVLLTRPSARGEVVAGEVIHQQLAAAEESGL